MPLFKSLSPSRSSLTIPIPPQNSNFATSPSSSRSQSPGEELQQLPRLGKMQDETLRNVKLVEELLRAWNEHRQALLACAKSGKRLARAMDELGQGTDKTSLICTSASYVGWNDSSHDLSADTETECDSVRGLCRDNCQMGKEGRQGI